MIFVTHVQSFGPYLKVCGQISDQVLLVENALKQLDASLVSTLTQPQQIIPKEIYLVHSGSQNDFLRRCEVLSANRIGMVKILLIDYGNEYEVPITQLRSLDAYKDSVLGTLPQQVFKTILGRIQNREWSQEILDNIRQQICNQKLGYKVDDNVEGFPIISLFLNDMDVAISLARVNLAQPVHMSEQINTIRSSIKAFAAQTSIQRQTSQDHNTRNLTPTRQIHSSIASSSKQLIMSHLSSNPSVRRPALPNVAGQIVEPPKTYQQVPPNMDPSTRIPFRDYSSHQTTSHSEESSRTPTANRPEAYNIPSFKSNTLMVGSRHEVYCSYIEDGPKLFSIHLKSNEQDLDQMMSSLGNFPLVHLADKPSVGMACVARYSEDNNLYRAVIMNIKPRTCLVAYLDYGNSEEVAFNNIYQIPVPFLKHTIFAMRFTLSGCGELGQSNEKLNKYFQTLIMEQELELVVKPLDGPPFVQYCDLYHNGHNIFEKLKDMANDCPKFVAPSPLVQDELVVIRFVESPKKFYVQQKSNLEKYDQMMDKLALYCQEAPPVPKLQVGAVCATTYGQDKDCYRVEIMELSNGNKTAAIKIVDFGIVIETNVNTLKAITAEFLALPLQAIECCLEGFVDIPNLSELSRDQLELLAEDAAGARRNFKVKIKSQRNDPLLVLNLIDDSTYPVLDLSTRMFKLAMPPKSFRHFEQQKYLKPSDRPVNAPKPAIDDKFVSPDKVLNSTLRESPPGRSAPCITDESTPNESANSWDLTSHTRASTVLSKSSRWNSPIRREESQETSPPKIKPATGVQSRLTQNWRESSAEKSPLGNSWRDEAARQERRKNDDNEMNGQRYSSSGTSQNWRLERSPPINNGLQEPFFDKQPLRQPVREDEPPKEDRRVKSNTNGKRERQPYSVSNKHIIPRFNRQKAGNDQPYSDLEAKKLSSRDEDSSGISSQSNGYNDTDILVDTSVYISAETQLACTSFNFNEPIPVTVCWWTSPLEFYVQLKSKVADYKQMMDEMQQFYQNRAPVNAGRPLHPIGAFIVSRYAKDRHFYRAQVLDYRHTSQKYKIVFVDVGNKTTATFADVWPMEQRFAQLERLAIQCGLDKIVLNYDRKEIEDKIDSHLHESQDVTSEFLTIDGDSCAVHILVNGISLRDTLLRDRVVSEAPADVDLKLLVGQIITIIMGAPNELGFQAMLFGSPNVICAFAPKKNVSFANLTDKGKAVPVRIDELTSDNVLLVTPLLPVDPTVHVTTFPVFQKCFHIEVSHVESINIVYIQNIFHADQLAQLLDDLFIAYENDSPACTVFRANKLVAAKSTDGNWYRCRIENAPADDSENVLVRYIDYGNCEEVPKIMCKDMLPKFSGTCSALAFKAYLPFTCNATITDVVMKELSDLTKGYMLDIEILDNHLDNWIVQISSNNRALSDVLRDKQMCRPLELQQVFSQIEVDVRAQTAAGKTIIWEPEPIVKVAPVAEVILPINLVPVTAEVVAAAHVFKPKPKGTPAYISHTDRPDHFYLQLLADQDELTQLQENIQIVAPSLPLLEDFTEGTLCIVKYSADENWYRAVIIDSDSEITSILFIDYGNTDTITDNNLIKAMNEGFAAIKRYAIPCALPVDVKSGGNEWSDEACAVLRSLLEEQITFEFLNQGERCSLVQLYHGDRDIMAELLEQNHAVRVPYIENGQTVYVSHINSLSDFYVQMEKDTGGLEIISDYLLNHEQFPVLTDFKINTICSAKFVDDQLWYRAKIINHSVDGTEVYFIDYGNASVATQLRELPQEIAELPHLSKCCALRKPKDIQYWSDEANQRFQEIADLGATVFTVNLIMPGKCEWQSLVDLIYKERNLTDELRPLCEQFSVSAIKEVDKQLLAAPTDSTATATNYETVSGFVSWSNSSSDFYVQPEGRRRVEAVIMKELKEASAFPSIENFPIGALCAAKFVDDGAYYRAKVLSSDHDGCEVLFIDYGNKSIATDLRALPEHIQKAHPFPCAIHCTLQAASQRPNVVPISENEFAADLVDRLCHFQLIDVNVSPIVVRMFKDAQCEQEIVVTDEVILATSIQSKNDQDNVETVQLTENATELTPEGDPIPLVVRGIICYSNTSSDFYVQPESRGADGNYITEQLASAATFPEATDLKAGDLCAAQFVDDNNYYRAKVIGPKDNGTEVHFIDFGNTATTTELRTLPDNLRIIPTWAIQCQVRPTTDGELSEADFTALVPKLSDNITYIQVVDAGVHPNIVRLFRDIQCNQEITVKAPTPLSPNSQNLINENAQPGDIGMFKDIIFAAANDATDRIEANDTAEVDSGKIIYAQLCWSNLSTDFYVLPDDRKTEFDLIAAQLTAADTFPTIQYPVVGSVIAAKFVEDNVYYRAKALDSYNGKVFFIDYGNTSTATDLRELPEDLKTLRPCALHCTLQPAIPSNTTIPLTESDFRDLCDVITTDQTCYFKVLDATTTPIKVQMFTDEECQHEVLVDPNQPGGAAAETVQLEDVLVHLQKLQASAAL